MPDQVYPISVSLGPHDAKAAADLHTALMTACAIDPGLGVDLGSYGEVILKGQSEQHLEDAIMQARGALKIDFDVGAPQIAYRETMTKSGPVLLEPMMLVEVVTSEDYISDIIGDLNSRRGKVRSKDQRGDTRVVQATVPLANMFGYVNTLRAMTLGRAQFTMRFDQYAQTPPSEPDDDNFPTAAARRA